MNTLKKTLALVATLAMAATAFASCGDDNSSSSSSKKEEKTTVTFETTTVGEEASSGELDASVKTGGDTFTVAAWNADDVPALIAQWKGLSMDTIKDDLADDKVDGIHFISFGVALRSMSVTVFLTFTPATSVLKFSIPSLRYFERVPAPMPIRRAISAWEMPFSFCLFNSFFNRWLNCPRSKLYVSPLWLIVVSPSFRCFSR